MDLLPGQPGHIGVAAVEELPGLAQFLRGLTVLAVNRHEVGQVRMALGQLLELGGIAGHLRQAHAILEFHVVFLDLFQFFHQVQGFITSSGVRNGSRRPEPL